VRVVFHALIIALVIRTFLFQPFNIPSGSMKETLLVGDYLFVSQVQLRLQPLFAAVLAAAVRRPRTGRPSQSRGDVVVFRLPKDDSTDYIKRRDRSAGRPHPGHPGRAEHQRPAGARANGWRIISTPKTAPRRA
jgi:signal peptidase I